MNRDFIDSSNFVDDIYQKYLLDPSSVDISWRKYFEGDCFQNINANLPPTLSENFCWKHPFIELEIDSLEPEIQQWITQREFKSIDVAAQRFIFKKIAQAELFENFLHKKFTGQKRFSLEGAETLIAMLAMALEESSLTDVVIGMAHRGRLNVLTNILHKPLQDVFKEFDKDFKPSMFEKMGDVKYHKGFRNRYETQSGHEVTLFLTPNPSHLESVAPVVQGYVRAMQDKVHKPQKSKILPLIIHGDAAIAGQGVVYETLQLSKLAGYKTFGSLHIIINNQIGFTTDPEDGRSTKYCSDIAKTFGAPVFRVHAERPEEAVQAMLMALEIRETFATDVFIDLICYRKYGHNESDEPIFTQPLHYKEIKAKDSIKTMYQNSLTNVNTQEIEAEISEQLNATFQQSNSVQNHVLENEQALAPKNYKNQSHDELKSSVKQVFKYLKELAAANFNPHPKLLKLFDKREQAVCTEKDIDWATAEQLAFITALKNGISIRFSGQDCQRGTFSQRHAVLTDQVNGQKVCLLDKICPEGVSFEIFNSSLSEMAVLGFEYGYSVKAVDNLTIWEAQYGDFSNGAQVIIDQYICSGEEKWQQKSPLVLFLPHGFEGQGPEHSSARLERFLSMASKENVKIANPSMPAQLYHLLIEHTFSHIKKPLIIFTPKALLRLPDCVSRLSDLSEGGFKKLILDECQSQLVKTLVICSGHVYFDLTEFLKQKSLNHLAILRVELIYPLDLASIKEHISSFKNLKTVLWLQEEPKNMGAWPFIHDHLKKVVPDKVNFEYVGRKASASPATGSQFYHHLELQEILNRVVTHEH